MHAKQSSNSFFICGLLRPDLRFGCARNYSGCEVHSEDVEILNQMARRVATRAKPTHSEAGTQTFCIRTIPRLLNFFSGFLRYYDSATSPACQESSAVTGSKMGQRLAVNSFTVCCSSIIMRFEVGLRQGLCRVAKGTESAALFSGALST